ncbi:hypothetical protein [Cysteiniphilum sp. JM-1]|uniref:hypothetical protein n=1 Tax=Cysteiniphilum TaxID=2056696 RepID=UPI0012449EB9|nr:hypothetical protein [Cysteiniphilum sp. JM-1]
MSKRKQIEDIIIEALKEIKDELDVDVFDQEITENTTLYGRNGALDSLTLVSLVADIEDRVSEEFAVDLVLAGDKAMSRTTSPFRTIGSLTDYIEELLLG